MRIGLGLAVAGALLTAAEPAAWVTQKAADLEVSARLVLEKDEQVQAVGSDLGRQYVIVEVKVTPRGGYPLTIGRDDFLLRSARDNERSTAESPERIAGGAVLVLGARGASRPVYSESNDPVFVGGMPGTGDRPRRLGGEDNVGYAVAPDAPAVASSQAKVSPVLGALKEKELHFGEIRKPVTGYLYFAVDPKQKAKNFYLHYKGEGGTADLHFR